MSQPLIARSYSPPSSTSTETNHLTQQQGRLQERSGKSLVSESHSSSSSPLEQSNGSSQSFKTPSRLISTSTSSLSAPVLTKPHVSVQTTATASSPTKVLPSTSKMTQREVHENGIINYGQDTKDTALSTSTSASGRGVETDNDIAVTTQPPGPCLTASGKPSGTAEASATTPASSQEPTTTTSALVNQIPTIAQRDALTTRVYTMCRTGGYTNWLHLLELSPLASQHHLSGYNCMKFGNQGSPYAYLPLSMQQPQQADALTERQRVSESEAMEWLIQKRKRKGKTEDLDRGVKRGGGVLIDDASRSRKVEEDGVEELESSKAAKVQGDSSGDSQMREASPNPANSTTVSSDDDVNVTGPLQPEVAISQEWERPLEQGEGETCSKPTEPTNTLTAEEKAREAMSQQASTLAIKTSDTHPISISPIIPPELLIDITDYIQNGLPNFARSNIKVAGEEEGIGHEVTTQKHLQLQVQGQRLIRCHTTRIDLCEVGQRAEREMIEAAQGKRKPRMLSFDSKTSGESPYLQTICKELAASPEEVKYEEVVPLAFGGQHRGFTIGNLLLSSCPGKKVRLTGPVRGRGAICRNLGLDLKRIKQLGVGALICCLDDEELNFLGAPWSLYEKEADQLGMEVIRLPMAEGFSPTDVCTTDNVITSVVEQYTLQGISVLVHCRGGVGRAGLIACTWMLKLGLIRSDRDESKFRSLTDNNGSGSSNNNNNNINANGHDMTTYTNGNKDDDGQNGNVFPFKNVDERACEMDEKESLRETMQVIHRLIDTIRRRRSPKAIETAEQVAFLFDYISFLREQESKRQLSA